MAPATGLPMSAAKATKRKPTPERTPISETSFASAMKQETMMLMKTPEANPKMMRKARVPPVVVAPSLMRGVRVSVGSQDLSHRSKTYKAKIETPIMKANGMMVLNAPTVVWGQHRAHVNVLGRQLTTVGDKTHADPTKESGSVQD